MTSIIPAEQILKGTNAQKILELFGDSLTSSYISSFIKYIPPSNESKLSLYNRDSIDLDLNDNNLKKEIEKLQLTKEKAVDLANLKTEYSKFSKDIFLHNRFESRKSTTIIGVGVDGSGYHPLNMTQENNAIRIIEHEATILTKWNPLSDDGEEYLKESAKNVCFWQASNVAQLPIGTPVEVCSAVIQLLAPVKEKVDSIDKTELLSTFKGKDFIEKRPEINGLQYFIDGNTLEIDNKNILINGKKDFQNQNFTRFGLNGVKESVTINLKFATEFKKFQCELTSDTKNIISSELLPILGKINMPNPLPHNDQRATILFLFTIFFEYGCYIYNFYNENLIKKIGKSSKDIIDYLKKANLLMLYNFLLLINYSLIRKFNIKNKNDEYYDANDFIYVDESKTLDTTTPLSYNKKIIFKVARRIFTNEIKRDLKEEKNNIRIYFKEDLYSIDNWNVDSDQFTLKKFPIAFNTDMDYSNPIKEIYDVDYIKTIERLTSFLLQDNNGEIPKIGEDQIITVGAPFQNDDVFKQTFEALDAYYDFIRNSKRLYTEYAQLKIDIFRSSYTATEIQKWYNLFMEKFRIIFTSYSNPDKQQIEILRVVDLVITKYKECRANELKYNMDTKGISKKNIFDSSKEIYRGLMRVKYGLAAEMVVKIAELTYLIYQSKNPGTPPIFISELYNIKKNVDKELSEKTKKMLETQKIQINRKLGKNTSQSSRMSNQIIKLDNLPPAPPQFTAIFNIALSQLGLSIQGISSQTPGAKESGKIILPTDMRLKVENIIFWQDLRKLFSGRTILIPVAKTRNNNFNDNEFYLVDIFKSILFNRLKIFKINQNGVINKKLIDSIILNNSYIMLTVNKFDLANPISWRCINYSNINKLLQNDGSFKNIKIAMGAFFNLIANNAVLTKLLSVIIPPNSNTTIGLIKYCNSIMKKELVDCTILISRQQFAQTVQNQMGTLAGTSGIDLISGLSYYQKDSVVTKKTENIVIR